MSEDGASFNLYGYNARSEVVGADRYWGLDMNDTNNPVLAQNFGYEYDPIGNRREVITDERGQVSPFFNWG